MAALARFAAAAGAALLLGCGASNGPEPIASPAAPSSCTDPLPVEEPQITAAPAYEAPTSQLAVDVRVPKQQLIKALSGKVPTVLASGQRTVGPGARLSYQVRRGEFELAVDGHDLLVRVPIKASAHVCMPIGPLCPTVGSCGPALTTTVRVPLLLDERGGFGPSKVAVKVDRSCSIGGYDATGQFVAAARQQTKELERRVDESLASVRPVVRSLWARLHEPVPIDGDSCIQPRWRRLLEGRPKLSAEALQLRVTLLGQLEVLRPCGPSSDSAKSAPPLPKAEPVETAPGPTELVLPLRLAWEDVSDQLVQRLVQDQASADGLITAVKSRGGRVSASAPAQAALQLGLGGSACGEAWLLAEPKLDEASEAIRLVGAELAPGQPQRSERLSSTEILARVAERARVAPSVSLAAASKALRTMVDRAAEPHQTRAAIQIELAAETSWTVLVTAERLATVGTLTGAIRVEPK